MPYKTLVFQLFPQLKSATMRKLSVTEGWMNKRWHLKYDPKLAREQKKKLQLFISISAKDLIAYAALSKYASAYN
ncbi:MAG: hypothetical protein JO297_00235 [Nitrososphaeraceae archaeon]|nr:hypothetical protein [Nitrososphaeraceae archaeon]